MGVKSYKGGRDIKWYNLPDEGEELHKVINIEINKFEKLVNDLKGKSKMMKALKKFIKETEMK